MAGSEERGAGGGVGEAWPALPYEAWKDTYATLHMWTQVVGKVRLAQGPRINHWWGITLYVTPRGLTTSAIPHGTRVFRIDFDFIDQRLRIEVSDGGIWELPLGPRSVADFHAEVMGALRELGVGVSIWTRPVEVPATIPFDRDREHRAYDPEQARRCWRILMQADRVLWEFRSRFLGKASPVHFFWGSFDLAATRFSGRRAPPHPGGVPNLADWVTREAYSHEVSSAGFWPGGETLPEPVFYAYAYPEPPGFAEFPIRPGAAYYHPEMREFILPYEAVRAAADPDATLLDVLQSSYEAAAGPGRWDRDALERPGPA
jgi:hypothetical protein